MACHHLSVRDIQALIVIILIYFTIHINGAAPIGDNVCERIEHYEVPVNVTVRRPYLIKFMEWCKKPPTFRCPNSFTDYRIDIISKNVTTSRVLDECCKGYSQVEDHCELICDDNCEPHGRCVAATDKCKSTLWLSWKYLKSKVLDQLATLVSYKISS